MHRNLLLPTSKGIALATLDPRYLVEVGFHHLDLLGQRHQVDHVARVVSTPNELDDGVAALLDAGAGLLEAPHRFPDSLCDGLAVDHDLEKVMATVALSSGLLVLAAPLRNGDQADRHLATWGPMVPHHVAIDVPDITAAAQHWQSQGYRGGRVVDDGALAQAFLASPTGQVLELISRADPDAVDTFSCNNIAALSVIDQQLHEA